MKRSPPPAPDTIDKKIMTVVSFHRQSARTDSFGAISTTEARLRIRAFGVVPGSLASAPPGQMIQPDELLDRDMVYAEFLTEGGALSQGREFRKSNVNQLIGSGALEEFF